VQNPFEDLVPQQPTSQQMTAPTQNVSQANPFEDLVPTQTAQPTEEPSVSDRAMASFLHQQSPYGPTQDYDPDAKNLSPLENFGIGIMDYLPFGGAASGLLRGGGGKLAEYMAENPKTAAMLENSLGGGTAGLANNGLSGLGWGTALGALTPLPPAIANGIIGYGAKKYAQSAIPAFTQKATNFIRGMISPSDAADSLGQSYADAVNKNTANWNKTNAMASQITQSMQDSRIPFDDRPYQSYIDNYLNNIKSLSASQKEPYNNAVNFAQYMQGLSPTSFEDLVSLRQNMNSHLADFMEKSGITKTDQNSKSFLTGLKGTLNNDLLSANTQQPTDEIMGYEGRPTQDTVNDFKNTWEDANQSHQNLLNFYKSPDSLGAIGDDNQLRGAYSNILNSSEGDSGKTYSPGSLDPAVVGQYLPSTSINGSQGTSGLQQLQNLLGSKEAAQGAAISSLFRPTTERGANTVDSAAIYQKLSPAQRDYMFGNSAAGQMLNSINDARLQFGREPEKTLSKITHGITSYGLPGLVGFGGGLASGENWDDAALTGLGTAAAAKGIGKIAGATATPASVQRAISLAQNPIFSGKYLGPLMQSFMNRGNQ
jgi:hypothetical protein